MVGNSRKMVNVERLLARLARQGPQVQRDTSMVACPGAAAANWATKVKSLSSYNVYNMRAVVIDQPGSEPTEIGDEFEAVNLAESFTQSGSLAAGTYAVVCRVGNTNVFYAPV